MMFSQEERCIYQNNQLIEVICQLRFPTILAIGAREPVDFQEAIRHAFPLYEKRQETAPPKVTAVPGQQPRIEQQKPVTVYQFSTQDRAYRITLCQDFISLTARSYRCWEEFAHRMDQPLASFIALYEPAFFERVGLRYLNAFSRKALNLEGTPWRELMEPGFLGLLSAEDVPEQAFSRCSQDVEASIPGGCRMRLHVGPGMVRRGNEQPDKEPRLIFDLDVSMNGNIPVNLSAASMQTVHAQADSIFRGAITDTLHDAMEPEK